MKNKYFTNPELSKRLQEIGVVRQFDYWWQWDHTDYKENAYLISGDRASSYLPAFTTLAYHFSDLLLPENEFKIWPEYQDQRGRFAAMVIWPEQYELDWQSWLLSELTKQEGK